MHKCVRCGEGHPQYSCPLSSSSFRAPRGNIHHSLDLQDKDNSVFGLPSKSLPHFSKHFDPKDLWALGRILIWVQNLSSTQMSALMLFDRIFFYQYTWLILNLFIISISICWNFQSVTQLKCYSCTMLILKGLMACIWNWTYHLKHLLTQSVTYVSLSW